MDLRRSLVKKRNEFEGWKDEILEEENCRPIGREHYRHRWSGRQIQVICDFFSEKEEIRV